MAMKMAMMLTLGQSYGPSWSNNCRQITFVTLNGFCPLSNILPPFPLLLTDNIKMDRIPTKIKCKIHVPFILTRFYKTSSLVSRPNLDYLVRYRVLLANSWLKTYYNGFLTIVPWSQGLGCFTKLTRWPESRALVEKNRTSPLSCNFCRCAVDCVFKTVISKLMLFIFFRKVMSWILLFLLLF